MECELHVHIKTDVILFTYYQSIVNLRSYPVLKNKGTAKINFEYFQDILEVTAKMHLEYFQDILEVTAKLNLEYFQDILVHHGISKKFRDQIVDNQHVPVINYHCTRGLVYLGYPEVAQYVFEHNLKVRNITSFLLRYVLFYCCFSRFYCSQSASFQARMCLKFSSLVFSFSVGYIFVVRCSHDLCHFCASISGSFFAINFDPSEFRVNNYRYLIL